MYENEEVEESVVKAFAVEVGAIFKNTSAKSSVGIEVVYFFII
jgi:hypothetical protein